MDMETEDLKREIELLKNNLNDFIYMTSHELNAPLRHIKNFANFLQEDHAGQLDPQGSEYLQLIAGATTKLEQMLKDMLLLSRAGNEEAQHSESFIAKLYRAVESVRNEANGREIKIETELNGDSMIGSHFLEACITQILSNSVKFNCSAEVLIRIETEIKFSKLHCRISDNGIGVAEENLETIFNPFKKLNSEKKFQDNSGLGLTIVRKHIELLKGVVSAETASSGLAVLIVLPLSI